jgi:hypothetical protein
MEIKNYANSLANLNSTSVGIFRLPLRYNESVGCGISNFSARYVIFSPLLLITSFSRCSVINLLQLYRKNIPSSGLALQIYNI